MVSLKQSFTGDNETKNLKILARYRICVNFKLLTTVVPTCLVLSSAKFFGY